VIDYVKLQQLEKEKLAYKLHRQSSNLAPDTTLHDTFAKLAKEELEHVETVQNILARL
jgi:rubrerythrin